MNDQEPVEAFPALPVSTPPEALHTDPLEDGEQVVPVAQPEEENVDLDSAGELVPEALHTDILEDVGQVAPVAQPEEGVVDADPGDEMSPEAAHIDLLEDEEQLPPVSQPVPQSEPEEQFVYLDPDDNLTDVLERLENIAARRIVMVVPPQTQLRSSVVWRIMRTRSRAMSKEIDVISSDRQIRAIAKYAGFGIIDMLASDKDRLTPRPLRSIRERREAHRFSRLYGNPGLASNFNSWPDPLPSEESDELLPVPLPEQHQAALEQFLASAEDLNGGMSNGGR